MIRRLLFPSLLMLALSAPAWATSGPDLQFTTSGNTITVSWTAVEGAYDYVIQYGPVVENSLEFANEVNLAGNTEFSFTMEGDRVFKVAVSAHGQYGELLAVSTLARVELPNGDVVGYFFLEVSSEFGGNIGELGQVQTSGGVWCSIYADPAQAAYTIHGLGDATIRITYNHPMGGCAYTYTAQGSLKVTGSLVKGSGKVSLDLHEIYDGAATTGDSCWGMAVPPTRDLNYDLLRQVQSMTLAKGALADLAASYNLSKYEVLIWEVSLDNCPECQ